MQYKIFDAHCDTALKIYSHNKSLLKNDFDVSIDKLSNYKKATYTMAIFNDKSLKINDIFAIIKKIKNEKINNPDIKIIFAIEGLGNTLDFEICHLEGLKNEGVKFISLTHNDDNFLCGGIKNNKSGLTDFGKETLKKMADFDFVLDLSHISDAGFFEAEAFYKKRICATHSNSRTICHHNRNLTDEMFLKIKKRKGVCGINLYPVFLSDTYLKKEVTSFDAIRHIEHFLSLGGEDNIGIGADFDGIDLYPFDIKNSSDLYILFDNMLKLNYKEDIINKISYQNFENMLNFE